MGQKSILLFTLPLFVLVAGVSLVGLLHPEIYTGATPNWLAQTVGQDAIDFWLVAPVLLVSGVFAYRGQASAIAMWIGSLMFLVYTFLIYCFTVRFNVLFLPYCSILGLSFYALLWFFTGYKESQPVNSSTFRVTGIYFIVIAVLFCLLWLKDILTANLGSLTPTTITEAGLYTNPVHVIDLALFLPGTFIVGRLAVVGHPSARLLAPAFLTFFILMDMTIASLSVIMMYRGLGGNYIIPSVMMTLALFSLVLLIKTSNESR